MFFPPICLLSGRQFFSSLLHCNSHYFSPSSRKRNLNFSSRGCRGGVWGGGGWGVLLGKVFPALPVSHCTANNFSSLDTLRWGFSCSWTAFCEPGQQNKANERSSLAYHRPLLCTAVHAERTNIRDTIKTDLSKCFLLCCCCCLFKCERLGCLEVKRTMLHLLFLLCLFINYIMIPEYQE